MIIANELLDNLPFRLAVHDGGWREAYVVAPRPTGGWSRSLSAAFDPVPDVLPRACRARRPGTAPGRRPRLDRGRPRRVRSGTLLVIDYMSPTTAELAGRPWREWLRTYRGHERGDHYLVDPGAAGHHERGGDRPVARARTRSAPRRSGCSCTGSASWSTRASGIGRRTPRGPTSRRCGCAAESARPRPCSIRDGLGGVHGARVPSAALRRRRSWSSVTTARLSVRVRVEGPDGRTSMSEQHDTIDALMAENRRFPPPDSFKDEALVVGHVPVRRGGRGRRGLLGAPGRRSRAVVAAVAHDPRMGAAVRQVVRRRHSSTCRRTASTATSPPGTATRSPSTGRASRATRARSPTPSCSTRCSGSPTCSRASASARAIGSTSTSR